MYVYCVVLFIRLHGKLSYMQLMGAIQCYFIHVFRTARDVVVVIRA